MAGHHSHEHHDHSHPPGLHVHGLSKNLVWAFVLNLLFTIIEFAGGIFTGSVAIFSDAIHDLGDTCAIGVALFLERFSQKGRDASFSYGYKRFSTLSALLISGVLVVGSVIILYEAIPRLFNPVEVHKVGMIWLSVVGILVNGLAVLKLKADGHSHNQKAVRLHLLEDVLGWAAVLVGAIVMYFTNWYILDPILSIGIAIFVLYNALKNVKSVLKIFLQGIPAGINIREIERELLKVSLVKAIHDVHIWSLDGQNHVLSLHVVLGNDVSLMKAVELKEQMRMKIQSYGIKHSTIEVETRHEHCGHDDC